MASVVRFSTLYKNDMHWNIHVVVNEIIREYGKINGKTITISKMVYGKNTGKSNATTDEEQAVLEANALYKKQIDKGYYCKSKDENTKNKRSSMSILPMLAQTYSEKNKKKIKFPCFVQPKLDGIRMLIKIENEIIFQSRTGKHIEGFHNIRNACKNISETVILDGEMYSHAHSFEQICSNFKNKKETELVYYVFDIIDSSLTFEKRRLKYEKIVSDLKSKYITCVHTSVAENDSDSFSSMHDKYIEEGYEGLMIRNKDSFYKCDNRSYDLLKLKAFTDDEYNIIDIKEAPSDTGTALIVCGGCKEFTARPIGTKEYRSKILKDKKKLIGKKVTIRYQNLTENNIPRFPVAVAIRDYE